MIKRYVLKEADTFNAVQFTGDNESEVHELLEGTQCGFSVSVGFSNSLWVLHTWSHNYTITANDWILRNNETGKVDRFCNDTFHTLFMEAMEAKDGA